MNTTLSRILLSTTAAGVALSGIGVMAASGANADTPGRVVSEHFPGSYWSTKAACQPYADAYVKKVVSADANVLSETSLDANSVSCEIFDKGWSYVVEYTHNDDETKGKLLPGDFILESDVWSTSVPKVDANGRKMESWARAARITRYTHSLNNQSATKAQCTNFTSNANSTLAAAVKAGQAVRLAGETGCSDWGGGHWNTFDFQYNADAFHGLWDGDQWSTQDAIGVEIASGTVGSLVHR